MPQAMAPASLKRRARGALASSQYGVFSRATRGMKLRPVKLVLFALVGVALSVCSAWGLLWAGHLRYTSGMVTAWPSGTPPDWPSGGGLCTYGYSRGVCIASFEYEDYNPFPSATRRPWFRASVTECGWPWLSLRARRWSGTGPDSGTIDDTPLNSSPFRAGVLVKWAKTPLDALNEPRSPIQPIWPGFFLDTVTFGLLAYVLSLGPRAFRRTVRLRCGLCTACAYPAGAAPICSECGRRVRPWNPHQTRPVRAYPPRLVRRAAVAFGAVSLLCIALYIMCGWVSLYAKGPHGWYLAVWHGQFALGHAADSFSNLGMEVSTTSFGLNLNWNAELVGRVFGIPLWLVVPALVLVGAGAWWRTAVRRGLGLHWPPPKSDTSVASASPAPLSD